tara:strand:+ start:812 stop:1552 length:741 start_codon:yes stop_codon:yes gene_type:complete
MNFIGFYALIPLLLFLYSQKHKTLLAKYSIIGTFIPQINLLGFLVGSLLFEENTARSIFLESTFITHSLIINILIIYLLLIFSNIAKKDNIAIIGKGIFIGSLTHIALDIIFLNEPLNIFWPIKDNTLTLNFIRSTLLSKISDHTIENISPLVRCFEFLSLYIYGKIMLITSINDTRKAKLIFYIQKWCKLQANLFIFFLTLYFVIYNMPNFGLEVYYILLSFLMLVSTFTAIKITLKTITVKKDG